MRPSNYIAFAMIDQYSEFARVSSQLKLKYYTDEDDIITELYSPLLKNATEYVRAAGFFRSSVFKLMTEDLLDFAIRKGKMTLITSVKVDMDDYDSIIQSLDETILIEELKEMRKTPDLIPATNMLAALISSGCLTVKIGIRKSGIYHRKKGYFTDGKNIVFFSGSGNESYTALRPELDEGSAEDFSVYWNLDPKGGWERRGKPDYERLYNEANEAAVAPSTKIITIKDVPKGFFDFINDEDWINLENHRIFAAKQQKKMRILWEKHFGAKKPIEGAILPDPMWDHQLEALEAWNDNAQRGILEHATGSGKTITALKAIDNQLQENGDVIILLPSRKLMKQWYEEIDERFSYPNLIVGRIGDGHKDKDVLQFMKLRDEDNRYILLMILNSAMKEDIFRLINQVVRNPNSDILLLVDECHRIGSDGRAPLCELDIEKVMGLSATPRVYGNEEGTNRIHNLLDRVVHRYPLRLALREGRLCPFFYNFYTVKLTTDEQDRYDDLRAKIRRLYAIWKSQKNPTPPPPQLLTFIYQSRSIIRGAENKILMVEEIIREHYHQEEKQHWLIYCDTIPMMGAAENLIREMGIHTRRYASDMTDFEQQQVLREFERDGGFLLAIRCLDEGVNIPCISHGIILSSTTNPREFIQRRGRLLRQYTGKPYSRIFDAFALPSNDPGESGFILSEILRARELAEESLNWDANKRRIDRIIEQYGITINSDLEEEIRENEEEE